MSDTKLEQSYKQRIAEISIRAFYWYAIYGL